MDSDLLERARAGNRQVFDSLVGPERPALRSYIYRMVTHPEDAEDLTQDALLRVVKCMLSSID
jgi:DNA-directed RNA polymerase specialized sigma24 family protein